MGIWQVTKRAAPTVTLGTAVTTRCYTNSGNTFNITTSDFGQTVLYLSAGVANNMYIEQPWIASAEL